MNNFGFAERIYVDGSTSSIPVTNQIPNLQIAQNLKLFGFSELYPLQDRVISYFQNNNPPSYLKRLNDICIFYPTGSGKTLCYVIPIISKLSTTYNSSAIVVAPTKVLCLQIFDIFKKLTQNIDIFISLGDQALKPTKSTVYIFTPPKLKRAIFNNNLPANLNLIVFDEVDKLTKHAEWVEFLKDTFNSWSTSNINAWVSRRPPQKIFISATLKDDPDFVHEMMPYRPVIFTVPSDENTSVHPNLHEYIIKIDPIKKSVILAHICINFLTEHSNLNVLIFLTDLQVLERIFLLFSSNPALKCLIYHKNIPRSQNERNLEKFSSGHVRILLATDYLARGIDISKVGMVVNYDLPFSVENYIHRVGRTCRGNSTGYAVTIIEEDSYETFYDLLKKVIRRNPIREFTYTENDIQYLYAWYQKALDSVK